MSDWRWMLCPSCGDVARYKSNVADHASIVCTGGHRGPAHAPIARVKTDPPVAESSDRG